MTTILALVKTFCEVQGLPAPSALVGSNEKSVKQYRGILTDLLLELSEHRFQTQRLTKTWTATGVASQVSLETVFGTDYHGLVPQSMWNITRNNPISGPLSDQTWQAFQSLPNSGPEYSYWISQGVLYLTPVPPAGETLSAAYITDKLVVDVLGTTPKTNFTADDDSCLLPDILILRGLRYKWKEAKGEAGWEDAYNVYIGLVAKSLARDTAPMVHLDVLPAERRPGIVIPPGNWNV